jgi:nitroimidazol reductase NimA-like FMN-containing flavoprotein (pyridoxamine 5'-phosphate oxidase superfamily)
MSSPTPLRRTEAPTERVRVRRVHKKATYDREAIAAILDEALVAHLGFAHEGQPYVIPTLHARCGDQVYVHGSAASRTMRALGGGAPMCLTVTLLDGLVFARTSFEHSASFRSVVILATARLVDDPDEKLLALERFTEHVLPGRWSELRPPSRKEMKATTVLALPLDEASAKIAEGGPGDAHGPDGDAPVWAGRVPLSLTAGAPVACEHLAPGIPVPAGIAAYDRRPPQMERAAA